MDDTIKSNHASGGSGDHQAFAGASNFGITNASFNSAGKNMTVYENCTISLNAAPIANEDANIKTFQEIANWLTKTNFRNIDSEALSKSAAGTGLWFMQTKEYHCWTREGLKVLWGTGMPGAGKTILSSIVIDQLRKECSPRGIPIIFAYCRYTEKYPTSQFLAAWIRQLLEYDPATLHFGRVYIVLDGLDEALEDVKARLLEVVDSLPSETRTLIMSRPLKSFEYLVQNVAFIDIMVRNEDIELFVDKKIAQIPRLRTLLAGKDDERERLCTTMKEKSRGMFLVASLQIEALKRSMSIKALFQALETLPSGVDDLYKHTLERIEAQGEPEASLAKRAIVWLVFAFRPLPTNALQDALAIDVERGVFDKDDIVCQEFLIDVCCGLVFGTSFALRLIHYTAHDFLKAGC
ncbi:hypothetical protein EST38_g14126, partial [Candolleomyces aberdarensis]